MNTLTTLWRSSFVTSAMLLIFVLLVFATMYNVRASHKVTRVEQDVASVQLRAQCGQNAPDPFGCQALLQKDA